MTPDEQKQLERVISRGVYSGASKVLGLILVLVILYMVGKGLM